MVPEALLLYGLRGEIIVPRFLAEHDHPWLRGLLDEYERFVGRPQRELDERLLEPLPGAFPFGRQRLAVHVLQRIWGRRGRPATMPQRVRATVFAEAARSAATRKAVLAAAARQLGASAAEVEAMLFADLPGERLVAPPDRPLSPAELALRANLALTQGLMFRATAVSIEICGNARALVRHAKLRGLICTVVARSDMGDAVLELSGPFSLFRRTLLYGRALGALVPLLAWSRRFRLRAECVLRDRRVTLCLATGDPIFPAGEPRTYDSKIEERFAGDFRRAARDWEIIREPEPVVAGNALLFPDFVLRHRCDGRRRWILEIVGFWTPKYLDRKLTLYRSAGLRNLILCIDDERQCADGDLPVGARVLRFRRHVAVEDVLRILRDAPPENLANASACTVLLGSSGGP